MGCFCDSSSGLTHLTVLLAVDHEPLTHTLMNTSPPPPTPHPPPSPQPAPHTQFNEGLTYMDWTFPYTGLDLTPVWDPELWLHFKEAVAWNSPELFWDKLWDRIAYSEWLGRY